MYTLNLKASHIKDKRHAKKQNAKLDGNEKFAEINMYSKVGRSKTRGQRESKKPKKYQKKK